VLFILVLFYAIQKYEEVQQVSKWNKVRENKVAKTKKMQGLPARKRKEKGKNKNKKRSRKYHGEQQVSK
jgi:hypothetical protein